MDNETVEIKRRAKKEEELTQEQALELIKAAKENSDGIIYCPNSNQIIIETRFPNIVFTLTGSYANVPMSLLKPGVAWSKVSTEHIIDLKDALSMCTYIWKFLDDKLTDQQVFRERQEQQSDYIDFNLRYSQKKKQIFLGYINMKTKQATSFAMNSFHALEIFEIIMVAVRKITRKMLNEQKRRYGEEGPAPAILFATGIKLKSRIVDIYIRENSVVIKDVLMSNLTYTLYSIHASMFITYLHKYMTRKIKEDTRFGEKIRIKLPNDISEEVSSVETQGEKNSDDNNYRYYGKICAGSFRWNFSPEHAQLNVILIAAFVSIVDRYNFNKMQPREEF